ncbi:putative Calcium-binding EF-hand family protein [Hibiscus syriacus]|uniref:Calcium-binding EF-hand family protein n=1 Tax=Hibiscus syriacus TaxID=106335 RepID=A0A6A3ANU3_HIBSY|nr:putative Calcium-binding EF-hand family protein [Hibiscus syriacus]
MAAARERSSEIVIIDVGSLASLKDELRDACSSMPQSYCIFNIPTILFRHNKNSFLPNCFSIGPMHHGKKHLVATEKITMKYLKACFSRVITSRHGSMSRESKEVEEQKVLSDLINAVKSIEKQASACYAGHDFAAELGDEFIKTMLLDGVFVTEMFPLPNETESLIELALKFFANTFTSHPPPVQTCQVKDQDIKHILDLLRLSLVLPFQEIKNKPTNRWQPIRSVTRLKEAGVKFKKGTADSVLDIKFNDGCLEIPSLLIQETTEPIFRNLIAYERCFGHCQAPG